ncbi:hypothetical protein ACNQGP_00635 [Flavobacterium sp. GT2N3]|uniref:hypothetical protein n=1 Tax=unclassified Flavobacterium TaxID=196869 RepID=UPI003AABEC6C
MNQELVASKMDLLFEQINNLENSGFFTEKEMDRFASPLRSELNLLQTQKKALENEIFGKTQRILGVSPADLSDLVKTFRECFNHSSIPNPHGMSDQESHFINKIYFVGYILHKYKDELYNPSTIPNHYGISDQEYHDAKAKHNTFFAPLKTLEIKVIDAEILTPNHQEA